MSAHQAFRRQPVPQQVAQKYQALTIPAPTRGIIQSENFAYMKPGGAMICDNWIPTMRGVKLRGGCVRWCELPEVTPVISSFEYQNASQHKMFAANATKLYDVTAGGAPTLVVGGQTSGNYAASQMANASGYHMMVVNDAGDAPLRYDGSAWTVLNTGQITGPPGSAVVAGENLVHVWKYKNRWFFIELNSMNAWYLPLDAIQGALLQIPLSGAAKKGGKLLFGATWSLDAGDGIDDKCVFVTDLGEVIIFTGSDPGSTTNSAPWHQEGLFQIPPPMGMNAHATVGGDLLIATLDGLVPISSALTKTADQLDLGMVSYNIRSMWRNEAIDKREMPWSMKRWDEYGGMFVTWPGGVPGKRYCAAMNTGTNAWARFPGWDATCFILMRGEMFFGTQDGIIMQADRTGYDDGKPYTATLVGNWGIFQQQASTTTWRQSRASFSARAGEPFQPQLSATTDYVITLPPPPAPGYDPGIQDVWDQGEWGPDMGPPPPPVPTPEEKDDYAQWDQPSLGAPVVRNTGWVSIGLTGYTHAPIVQVTVAQQARPDVELIAIDATFERMGVNV